MSTIAKLAPKHVNYLWDDEAAAKVSPAQRLVYRSNLLGSDQRITNTGGGNITLGGTFGGYAPTAQLMILSDWDANVSDLDYSLDPKNNYAAQNTLVVLWGDHGWHLGEKQHWGKWTGWQRATHVPLIVSPPAGALADGKAVAAVEMDVEHDRVGTARGDAGERVVHRRRLADHLGAGQRRCGAEVEHHRTTRGHSGRQADHRPRYGLDRFLPGRRLRCGGRRSGTCSSSGAGAACLYTLPEPGGCAPRPGWLPGVASARARRGDLR